MLGRQFRELHLGAMVFRGQFCAWRLGCKALFCYGRVLGLPRSVGVPAAPVQRQGKRHSPITEHPWLDRVSDPGPLGPWSLLSPQLKSRISKRATPSPRLWPVQRLGIPGRLGSGALAPGPDDFRVSGGPGREGQAWVQFTCSAPALHPHPTGLGAGGPRAPRPPEALRGLTLL